MFFFFILTCYQSKKWKTSNIKHLFFCGETISRLANEAIGLIISFWGKKISKDSHKFKRLKLFCNSCHRPSSLIYLPVTILETSIQYDWILGSEDRFSSSIHSTHVQYVIILLTHTKIGRWMHEVETSKHKKRPVPNDAEICETKSVLSILA